MPETEVIEVEKAAAPAESAAPAASETEPSAESAPVETPETQAGEEAVKGEPPKKEKGGVQRRIDELTREKRLAQAEAEFWKSKAIGKSSEPAKEKQELLTEPDPADYDGSEGRTLGDFIRDVRAYDRQQNELLLEKKLNEQRRALIQQTEQEIAAGEWEERVEAAEKAHTDYREVTTAAMELLETNVGPGTQGIAAAVQQGEAGPELLYYLGQHPDEVERISALSPRQAYIAMLRIEARLEKPTGGVNKDVPPQTRAPRPPSPIRKPSAGVSLDPDNPDDAEKMSADEYWKAREAKRKAQRR